MLSETEYSALCFINTRRRFPREGQCAGVPISRVTRPEPWFEHRLKRRDRSAPVQLDRSSVIRVHTCVLLFSLVINRNVPYGVPRTLENKRPCQFLRQREFRCNGWWCTAKELLKSCSIRYSFTCERKVVRYLQGLLFSRVRGRMRILSVHRPYVEIY